MLVRMPTLDGFADALDKLEEDITRSLRASCASALSARVLQRHVDVFHQRVVLGNGIEQLLRDLIGIRIEEANPFSCAVSICARRASNCANPSLSPKSSP